MAAGDRPDRPLTADEWEELQDRVERAIQWCDCGDEDQSVAPDVRRVLAEVARLTQENAGLREALLQHRSDLHSYSKRPCPTCRQSAKVLGLTGKVPDCCALMETDGTTVDRYGIVTGNKFGALAGAVRPRVEHGREPR